ncbi:MAG: ABC transporter permease [Anaerolineales bacterium]
MLEQLLQILTSVAFYAAIVRLTTPLLLAAMGGLVAERAGIVTFGMEGMMLMGAVAGVTGSYLTGSVLGGLALAMVAGVFVAMAFAFMAVTVGANQVVSAVALNIGALGLSSTIYAVVFAGGEGGVVQEVVKVASLRLLKIPLLGDLPVLGPIFFNQLPLVYLAFLTVPAVWFVLYRTTWGLKIRAVGEHPHAADTVGISVVRVRYLTLVVTGVLAGLSGAFLSIGQLNTFQENMSAGRGFIAYTAIVFGKWEPVGVFLGTLLFGMADALQLRIQALNLDIPYQLLVAFPYLVTLIVLVLFVGKATWPTASGMPFKRESK